MLTPEMLRKQVHSGTIAPLYCIYGPNSALIDKTVATLHTAIFGSAKTDFDFDHFDADVHDPAIILNAAQTRPLRASKRLVVVKRAEVYKTTQWGIFKHYFTKPSAQCCLVFVAHAEKHDKLPCGEKLANIFLKSGAAVFCGNPKKEAQGQIIEAELKKCGKKIARDALDFMAEAIGGEGLKVRQELEKLVLFCADKPLITLEDAMAVVCGTEQVTIFNLLDAIAAGNTAEALKYINELLDRGQDPLPMLGMIARQFRLIAVAGEAIREGKKAAQITAALNEFDRSVYRGRGYQPWQVEKFIRQAHRWPIKKLAKAFDEISVTDAQLKSSRIDKRHLMERLVFALGCC